MCTACDLALGLTARATTPWSPKTIEVMLWGYEHSPKEPKAWPASVPPPANQQAAKTGVLKHLIDARHHEPLRAFLRTLERKQAVGLYGKKWSVRTRVVVPGDAYIRNVRGETWKTYALEHKRLRELKAKGAAPNNRPGATK